MILRPSEESWVELDDILNNKIIVNNEMKIFLTLWFVCLFFIDYCVVSFGMFF
jgi:hypothetical protein